MKAYQPNRTQLYNCADWNEAEADREENCNPARAERLRLQAKDLRDRATNLSFDKRKAS